MAEIGNVTVRVDAVITDEQYREAMGAVRAANERMDLLETENAKLRELVRDMVLNMGGCALHGNPLRLREFGNRAKELGVEIDE